MISRRKFLASCIALAVAPAVAKVPTLPVIEPAAGIDLAAMWRTARDGMFIERFTLRGVESARDVLRANNVKPALIDSQSSYVMFLHPSTSAQLKAELAEFGRIKLNDHQLRAMRLAGGSTAYAIPA